ncbi:hypothetical protein [Candidatus Hodgkinia cicadicola]
MGWHVFDEESWCGWMKGDRDMSGGELFDWINVLFGVGCVCCDRDGC